MKKSRKVKKFKSRKKKMLKENGIKKHTKVYQIMQKCPKTSHIVPKGLKLSQDVQK